MKMIVSAALAIAILAANVSASQSACGQFTLDPPCPTDQPIVDGGNDEGDDGPLIAPPCSDEGVLTVLRTIIARDEPLLFMYSATYKLTNIRTTRTDWPINGRTCTTYVVLSFPPAAGRADVGVDIRYTVQLNDVMDGSYVVNKLN